MRYLSNFFLSWYVSTEGASCLDRRIMKRAYDMWHHACRILFKENIDEFHLTDALTTLKRSLNYRLKSLENCYFFRKMPVFPKGQKFLEFLETLNIVRPFMLKQLMEIRNDIEHNDAKPPSYKRCKELLDVVWYFLKSTDPLLKNIYDNLYFEKSDKGILSNYSLVIDFQKDKNWKTDIRGWIPQKAIYLKEEKDTIKIKLNEIHTKNKNQQIRKIHNRRKDTDLYIKGQLLPDDNTFRTLVRMYFEL